MKKLNLYTGLFAAVMVGLTSCKNNLDVLAPGEEMVSVYGIINPNEPVQNIRINKVYITDGDALAAAQNANTINYDTSEIRVTLQRFMGGSTTPTLTTVGNATKKEIVLTGTVITTASGSFSPNQTIWQTSDKLYSTGNYKLTVKIKSTGKEITSTTTSLDSVKSYNKMPFIYLPNPNPTLAYPMHCGYVLDSPPGTGTKQIAYVDYSNVTATSPFRIKFSSIADARLYSVIMRFHYKTISMTDDTTNHYADYNFLPLKSSTLAGGEAMEVSFNPPDFYTNLALQINKNNETNVKTRVSHYMEYIIYAGDENLSTFLQINQPSNTIAQDKPNYSNINGGVGVFATRSRSSITKELWSSFIDEIADNPATSSLLFNKNYTFMCP